MAHDSISSGKGSNSRTNTLMVFLGVIVVLLLTVIVLILKNNKSENPDSVTETAKTETTTQQSTTQSQPEPQQTTPQVQPPVDNTVNTSPPPSSSDRLTPMERGILPGNYPEASTRYLDENDLYGKSVWELKVMRNEIYARYGYIFRRNKDIKSHFESQSWYVPKYYNVDHMLNKYEKRNANFIRSNEPK